jgi:hypothetical protein
VNGNLRPREIREVEKSSRTVKQFLKTADDDEAINPQSCPHKLYDFLG